MRFVPGAPRDADWGICHFGITEAIGGVIAGLATSAGAAAATAATVGAVGADALVGAGTGALIGGVTGGGKGALQGALLGGVTGGVGGALSGAAGTTASGILDANNAAGVASWGAEGAAGDLGAGGLGAVGGATNSLFGVPATAASGALSGAGDALVNPLTGAALSANPLGGNGALGTSGVANAGGGTSTGPASWLANSSSTAGDASWASNPLGTNPSAPAAGGSGNNLFGGKISNTSLLLGALSAAGSLFNKPQQSQAGLTAQQLAAIQKQQGPTWNQGLNTNVPGRQAVAPAYTTPTMGTTPATINNPNSWYTYGSRPEATFFQGNSLNSFGWARGGDVPRAGALQEVSSANARHVPGPGTGVSDDVPAKLSRGEYILTYDDVARIGNPRNPKAPGANDRGAKILDQDRGALARLVGQKRYVSKSARYAMNEPKGRAA